MIICKNLIKSYPMKDKTVIALDDVSIEIKKGEFVSLRGPSGCGKSSLLLTLGGMIKPTTGTVIVNETNLYQLNPRSRSKFRGGTIGFIFQAFHLIPYLDVKENILTASICNGKDLQKKAMELIEKFHLTLRINHKPSELSTGEKQRVALARAFLNSPSLVLADEPTGNLDPENTTIVMNHLKEYQKEGGTIVLVTHQNNNESYSDRTIFMDAGKIKN